jgi:uncharacterized protein (TIGR02246 family)
MKTLRTTGLTVMLAVALSGCGNDGDSAGAAAANRAADDYEITQIVTKWHDAVTTKDIDLAMSLFADDAVFTIAGQSVAGKDQIRNFLAGQGAPFKPQNHWTSLTHTPNIRHTLSGDRGTLFFECHYFDTGTRQLVSSVSADSKVARIGGRWVFTSLVAGNAILG